MYRANHAVSYDRTSSMSRLIANQTRASYLTQQTPPAQRQEPAPPDRRAAQPPLQCTVSSCPETCTAGETLIVRVEGTDATWKQMPTVGAVLLPAESEDDVVTWTNVGSQRPRRGVELDASAPSTKKLQLRLRQSTSVSRAELRRLCVRSLERTAYIDVFGSYYVRDEEWRRDDASIVPFEATVVNHQATGGETVAAADAAAEDAVGSPAAVVELKATVTKAGSFDLYLYAEMDRVYEWGRVWAPSRLLHGAPFSLRVAAEPLPSLETSRAVMERIGLDASITAGERQQITVTLADQYGNSIEDAFDDQLPPQLVARHVVPAEGGSADQSSGNDWLGAPKRHERPTGTVVYVWDVVPTTAGSHEIQVSLMCREMTPIRFSVHPASAYCPRCTIEVDPTGWLLDGRPIHLCSFPCEVHITLYDRFNNRLDHGGVRVDARARGVGASACLVNDNRDGTYTVVFIKSAPGDVRLDTRVDGYELRPLVVGFSNRFNDGLAVPTLHGMDEGDGIDVSEDEDEHYDYDDEFARLNRKLMCPTCNSAAPPVCPYADAVATDFCVAVCQACLDEGQEVVVLPCGHRCMCRDCWELHVAAVLSDQL